MRISDWSSDVCSSDLQNVKDAILAASELDTRLVMRPLRNTERVLANAGVERLLAKERALGDAIGFADIAPEVAGVYPRVMRDGDMDAGAWRCGMVAGLIRSEEQTSDLQSLMRNSYAVFC